MWISGEALLKKLQSSDCHHGVILISRLQNINPTSTSMRRSMQKRLRHTVFASLTSLSKKGSLAVSEFDLDPFLGKWISRQTTAKLCVVKLQKVSFSVGSTLAAHLIRLDVLEKGQNPILYLIRWRNDDKCPGLTTRPWSNSNDTYQNRYLDVFSRTYGSAVPSTAFILPVEIQGTIILAADQLPGDRQEFTVRCSILGCYSRRG